MRLSSSRSPAIVMTMKPIHQSTAWGMERPASQTRFPANQRRPPSTMVTMKSAHWMRSSCASATTSTMLPSVIVSAPTKIGIGSRMSSVPRALSAGAASAQRLPMPTARSKPINVPIKPQIMSGPWLEGRRGASAGQPQPRRISPAHSAASSASTAAAMRTKRTGRGRCAAPFADRSNPKPIPHFSSLMRHLHNLAFTLDCKRAVRLLTAPAW